MCLGQMHSASIYNDADHHGNWLVSCPTLVAIAQIHSAPPRMTAVFHSGIRHTEGRQVMFSGLFPAALRHVNLTDGTLSLDPGQTKNDDARIVYLTPALHAAIEAQLARLAAFERANGQVCRYLFTHTSGRHAGKQIKDFVRAWRFACKTAGVPGRMRHDFRRTAVRDMVNVGVPEKVAMTITDHKTRAVFDRYHIVS